METTTETDAWQGYLLLMHTWETRIFDREGDVSFLAALQAYSADMLQAIQALEAGTTLQDDENTARAYVLRLEWPQVQKDFMILLRDVGVNYVKAQAMGSASIEHLMDRNRSAVRAAAQKSRMYVDDRLEATSYDPKAKQQHMQEWSILNDSWPIVNKQLGVLVDQINQLQEQQDHVQSLTQSLSKVRQYIESYISEAERVMVDNDESIATADMSITENINEGKYSKIAQVLEQIGDNRDERPRFALLNAKIDEVVKTIPSKQSYPISTKGSEVLVRDGDIGREAKQWLEAEAYPLVYEVDDIVRDSDNDRNMAIMNLRNRASLMAKRSEDGEPIDTNDTLLASTIETYREKGVKHREEMDEIKSELLARVHRSTDIKRFFDPNENLLDVSIESSIKNIGFRQSQLYIKARDWVKERYSVVSDLITNIEDENSLSTSEKVSRKIQQLNNPDRSRSYANIFLTKGYIGESFVVGRDAEIDRVRATYTAWQKGYRGTVLLSGHRKSGRTLMAQMIATTLFPKRTISLVPGLPFKVAGRSFTSTNDLEEALTQMVKYGLRERYCVLLDNIELWHDEQHTLSTNMRSLLKVLDSHSDKIFFVVTTTHWVSNHLEQHLDWQSAFQLIVNLDRLDHDDVADAILVRHSATHKSLIDTTTGEKVTAFRFRRRCRQLHRRSQGVIGETLSLWANTIYDHDSDKDEVYQEVGKHHQLPEIVDNNTGPVLKTLLLYRKINEYQMMKVLGTAFNTRYRPVLRRLTQMGLLARKVDGRLHIKSHIVNEVARQLDDNQWINQDFTK